MITPDGRVEVRARARTTTGAGQVPARLTYTPALPFAAHLWVGGHVAEVDRALLAGRTTPDAPVTPGVPAPDRWLYLSFGAEQLLVWAAHVELFVRESWLVVPPGTEQQAALQWWRALQARWGRGEHHDHHCL